MGPAEVAAILFGVFALLIILRVPVAFALGLACVPVFFIDDRLTPFLLLNEMLKSYNSFLLLAIPFFMLAANLMNSAGITEKLIALSRALVQLCRLPYAIRRAGAVGAGHALADVQAAAR